MCTGSLSPSAQFSSAPGAPPASQPWPALVDALRTNAAVTNVVWTLDTVPLQTSADLHTLLDVAFGLAAPGRTVDITLRKSTINGANFLIHRALTLRKGGSISVTLDGSSITNTNILALIFLGVIGGPVKLAIALQGGTQLTNNLVYLAAAMGVQGDALANVTLGDAAMTKNRVVGAAATAITGKATTNLAYQGISINSNNGYMCAAACVGGPYTQVLSPSMSISVTGQCVPSASISATEPTLSCEPAFNVAAVGVDNVATASTLLTDATNAILPTLIDLADAFNTGTLTLDTLLKNMQRPTFLTPLFNLLSTAANIVLHTASAAGLLAVSTFSGAAGMLKALLP
ncbi:hypothetical protein N2152v2_001704 [Parachlorella kessleri]